LPLIPVPFKLIGARVTEISAKRQFLGQFGPDFAEDCSAFDSIKLGGMKAGGADIPHNSKWILPFYFYPKGMRPMRKSTLAGTSLRAAVWPHFAGNAIDMSGENRSRVGGDGCSILSGIRW